MSKDDSKKTAKPDYVSPPSGFADGIQTVYDQPLAEALSGEEAGRIAQVNNDEPVYDGFTLKSDDTPVEHAHVNPEVYEMPDGQMPTSELYATMDSEANEEIQEITLGDPVLGPADILAGSLPSDDGVANREHIYDTVEGDTENFKVAYKQLVGSDFTLDRAPAAVLHEMLSLSTQALLSQAPEGEEDIAKLQKELRGMNSDDSGYAGKKNQLVVKWLDYADTYGKFPDEFREGFSSDPIGPIDIGGTYSDDLKASITQLAMGDENVSGAILGKKHEGRKSRLADLVKENFSENLENVTFKHKSDDSIVSHQEGLMQGRIDLQEARKSLSSSEAKVSDAKKHYDNAVLLHDEAVKSGKKGAGVTAGVKQAADKALKAAKKALISSNKKVKACEKVCDGHIKALSKEVANEVLLTGRLPEGFDVPKSTTSLGGDGWNLSSALMNFANNVVGSVQKTAGDFVRGFLENMGLSNEEIKEMVSVQNGQMTVKCSTGNMTGKVLARFIEEGETSIACTLKDNVVINGKTEAMKGNALESFLDATLDPIITALRGDLGADAIKKTDKGLAEGVDVSSSQSLIEFELDSKSGSISHTFKDLNEVEEFKIFYENKVEAEDNLDSLLTRFKGRGLSDEVALKEPVPASEKEYLGNNSHVIKSDKLGDGVLEEVAPASASVGGGKPPEYSTVGSVSHGDAVVNPTYESASDAVASEAKKAKLEDDPDYDNAEYNGGNSPNPPVPE